MPDEESDGGEGPVDVPAGAPVHDYYAQRTGQLPPPVPSEPMIEITGWGLPAAASPRPLTPEQPPRRRH